MARSTATLLHPDPHPLAGQTVKLRPGYRHYQFPGMDELEIEDWHDRIAGKSWMVCDDNPACLIYAMRKHDQPYQVPTDDEVVYGKWNGLGSLVHVCELAQKVSL